MTTIEIGCDFVTLSDFVTKLHFIATKFLKNQKYPYPYPPIRNINKFLLNSILNGQRRLDFSRNWKCKWHYNKMCTRINVKNDLSVCHSEYIKWKYLLHLPEWQKHELQPQKTSYLSTAWLHTWT